MFLQQPAHLFSTQQVSGNRICNSLKSYQNLTKAFDSQDYVKLTRARKYSATQVQTNVFYMRAGEGLGYESSWVFFFNLLNLHEVYNSQTAVLLLR